MNIPMFMILIACSVAAYAATLPHQSNVVEDKLEVSSVGDTKFEDETLVGAESAQYRGGGGRRWGGGGGGWGGGGGGWGGWGGNRRLAISGNGGPRAFGGRGR